MKKFILFVLTYAFLLPAFAETTVSQETQKVFPKKVEADTNYDGKIDRVENFKDGKIELTEADTDFDGKTDDWTYFGADGKPVRGERDTNRDGKPDAWFTY